MNEFDYDDEPIYPFATYTIEDLRNLPQPEWLVKDLVPAQSYGTMFGVPGAGKSFLMQDLLLSVAAGKDFHGKEVQQGKVLYFAGEGVIGLQRRVRAWMHAYAADIDPEMVDENFRVVPHVPSMASHREQERVIATAGHDARWIVFDTLARGMGAGGLNENSAADMSRANDFAEGIRNKTGAAVWHVHHTNKEGSVERGSVALRGACDTMILARPDEGVIQLAVSKQKDAPEAAPMTFRLTDVEGTGSAVMRKDSTAVGNPFATQEAKFGVRTPPPVMQNWRGDF